MLFELFQVRVHGVVSSHSRAYEETVHFPRQGWWVKRNSSQTQGPEHAQKRVQGEPRQRQSAVTDDDAVRQPPAHVFQRLAHARTDGQEGRGLYNSIAEARGERNPTVILIVTLLAGAARPTDRATLATRAPPQDDFGTS